MSNALASALEGAALPPGLRDLPNPPARLFVHGEVPRGPCIAIVGTRSPSPEAEAYAEELAYHLAEHGVAIVSGGAAGIDVAAHRGALAAGGVTLVVGPSSFEHPYPAEHAELFAQIVSQRGGYVSPFEAKVLPRRHHFFERNSYLVALSHALVLVEAPLRSGARNAARWARELSRPCFVVPSPPWNSRGLGCIAELGLGGRPLSGPDDILRWLQEQRLHFIAGERPGPRPEQSITAPPESAAAPRAPSNSPRAGHRRLGRRKSAILTPLQESILDAVRAGARYPDSIASKAGLSAAEVSHGLLLLLLSGHITQADSSEVTIAR
jgi:DNA processing protein